MAEVLPDPGRNAGGRRRRAHRRVAGAALLLAVGACRPVEQGAAAPQSLAWTREGLEEQPRSSALRGGASDSLGYEPGPTPWKEVPSPTPDGAPAGTPPASPGEALTRVAEALGWVDMLGESAWEQTSRVWAPDPDQAVGVVLQWGLQDDAVAGRDLRAQMRLVDGVWQVERLEQRFHCRRGVSDDGVCM